MDDKALREMLKPMDAEIIESVTPKLDGLIAALRRDLSNGNTPDNRNARVMDMASLVWRDVPKETLATMFSLAIFRLIGE